MIMEIEIIRIKQGCINDFERDFRKASLLLTSMQGYIHHELFKCVQEDLKYILLVKWHSITDHMVRFRQSQQYEQWKALLEPYYVPLPEAEHYVQIKTTL